MLNIINRINKNIININDMDKLIGNVEIIDIRETYEYKNGSLKTAKNIPMNNLLANPEKYLNKDKRYYIMCQSGGRSAITTKILSKQGFNVVDVAGGIGSYVGTKRN